MAASASWRVPSTLARARECAGRLDFSEHRVATRSDGTPAVWTHPLTSHVRDMQFMNEQNVVFAAGRSLSLAHLQAHDGDMLVCEIVGLPDFHRDVIREV